jgi:hypothetical protein
MFTLNPTLLSCAVSGLEVCDQVGHLDLSGAVSGGQ